MEGRFTTDRLVIEPLNTPLKSSELAELEGILDKDVTAFLPPSLLYEQGKSNVKEWADTFSGGTNQVSSVRLVVGDDESPSSELAGLLLLMPQSSEKEKVVAHLGYIFGKKYWGRGLATELLRGLVRQLALDGFSGEIHAGVAKGNPASVAVLKKVGFQAMDKKESDAPDDVDFFCRTFVTSIQAKKTVALLGSTGRVGGWVLEGLLDSGYRVRVLVRSVHKLQHHVGRYGSNVLTVLEGSSEDADAVSRLIEGCDVVISCLGSPGKDALIMTSSARALIAAIAKTGGNLHQPPPRIIWTSSKGINDGRKQAQLYGCTDTCLPSCNFCGLGWGCFGCLQSCIIMPCFISRPVWDDMATAEDVLSGEEDAVVRSRLVIVRPTVMGPISEAKAFSDEWRAEGGDEVGYVVKSPSDPPPSIYINRRSIAKFLLDAVENEEWDGKEAVQLFQGD